MLSTLFLWALAVVLGVIVFRRGGEDFNQALRGGLEQFIVIMPRIALALLTAGFVAKLVPAATIGQLIGPDSGFGGILLAALVGGLMPSGPTVAFPIVVVLRAAGAGVPQIVAFLTAWSVFAWHRVLIYEVSMLGWQFAAIRMASSLVLPFVAAGIAIVLCAVTGFR